MKKVWSVQIIAFIQEKRRKHRGGQDQSQPNEAELLSELEIIEENNTGVSKDTVSEKRVTCKDSFSLDQQVLLVYRISVVLVLVSSIDLGCRSKSGSKPNLTLFLWIIKRDMAHQNVKFASLSIIHLPILLVNPRLKIRNLNQTK